MSASWPMVRLGEVLRTAFEPHPVDPSANYPIAGIYGFGRGMICRTPMSGQEIAAPQLFRIKAGQFIYSRLKSFEGAFAVVSYEADGYFVSNEFPTFDTNRDRLDAAYLGWYFQRKRIWHELASDNKGIGARRERLHPDRLLDHPIPLPPLAEQRRIVARIDALAAKINEARGLRKEATAEVESVVLSLLHDWFVKRSSCWSVMPMDVAIEVSDRQVDPTLPDFAKLPHISGENIESKTCRLLPWRSASEDGVRSNNYLFSPGSVLYSKIRPYLRKATHVDFTGVCSAEVYPVRVISPKIDPHFMKWTLVAEPFTAYANRLSGRTRMPKLNRKQLFDFEFKHPPIEDQRSIVAELEALQAKIDAVKELQAQTAAELDALLPAILDRAFKGEL